MFSDDASKYGKLLTEEDLSEMVLRLAHEIRNPLATIKSGVQLMRRLTSPKEEMATHFESVLQQVDRIDQSLGDMQRFVRLGVGRPSEVEVSEVVAEVAGELGLEPTGDGVRTIVGGGPPLLVRVDEDNLRLCLRELASNAMRFSPRAPSFSWGRRDDGLVEVRIDDEGPGVAPEVASRIMRPFFSTSTQGTGLGLNIAEKICRLSGGWLEWCNLPGRGCRFTLVLPGR